MTYNVETVFPDNIDSRLYWSDMNISQIADFEDYQQYLKQGRYSDANGVLVGSDAFYYGGWLINLLVNRLKAMDAYIPYKYVPSAGIYDSATEPEETFQNILVNNDNNEYVEGTIWLQGGVSTNKTEEKIYDGTYETFEYGLITVNYEFSITNIKADIVEPIQVHINYEDTSYQNLSKNIYLFQETENEEVLLVSQETQTTDDDFEWNIMPPSLLSEEYNYFILVSFMDAGISFPIGQKCTISVDYSC